MAPRLRLTHRPDPQRAFDQPRLGWAQAFLPPVSIWEIHMKAIGYRTPGDLEVLVDLEVPRPMPGPRDLLVAVKAVSVNPADVKRRQFESPDPGADFRILGYDAAGVV